MKHKLTHNLGLKLVSVLAACMVWLMVMDSSDPEQTQGYRNISVTQKNVDTITQANKTYSVVDGTDKVNVYVTARRSVRSRLKSTSFTVTADLENYNEALGSIPLEVTCSDPSVTQEMMRVQPSSLKIKMEDKVEATFGIVPTSTGKPAKGCELGEIRLLSGDTIKIAGPRSLINIIGKVTVPVDISSLSQDKAANYKIRIEDKNGTVLSENQMKNLELKMADGVTLKEKQVRAEIEIWNVYTDVPLAAEITGEPADGYQVTEVSVAPGTVNLAASQEAFQELGETLKIKNKLSIEGASENKEFQIDLNETLDDYEHIRLETDTASTVLVSVRVDKVGTKTYDVPVSEIEMQNAPQGKKLVFTPADKIPVNVRAADSVLGSITASDIKCTLDLTDCAVNGNYNVMLQVSLPENCELGEDVFLIVNVEDEEWEEEVELLTEE